MEQQRKRGPAIWVPPPAIFAVAFLAGLWLEAAFYRIRLPFGTSSLPLKVAGMALALAGLALMLWAFIVFQRARTSVLPFRESSTFVQRGPYRYSRNPIYAGDVLVYLGASIALDSGWPLVLLPFTLLVIRFYVIRREEAYLSATFGEEYDRYRARVRRWI